MAHFTYVGCNIKSVGRQNEWNQISIKGNGNGNDCKFLVGILSLSLSLPFEFIGGFAFVEGPEILCGHMLILDFIDFGKVLGCLIMGNCLLIFLDQASFGPLH